ncbi:MAG: UDP-3-O-acylglucosamine N-acyltransferase [Planctomycetota bacterium]|nr:MAG: UDP-3-O-acylglucosamine N-acyltransferase [Planctomycetota bacterium]
MRLDRTVAEIADLLHGEVEGPSARHLHELRALEPAGPSDLAPLLAARHEAAAQASRAGCLLVSKGCGLQASELRSLIRVPDAEAALDQLTAELGPDDPGPEPGVHPSAVVEQGAEIGSQVRLGPGVVVRRGARIEAGCTLWANVYVGVDARLGAESELFPGVYIGSRCELGKRVRVHANACVGADGFGYRQDAQRRHVKSPQVGRVILGDDVELGAHVTVDRGRFEDTLVGAGTKLDDHVHLGHNVKLGEHCAIAGGTVFAGGATLGDHVMIGGNSGVGGNVTMAEHSVLGGMSMLTRDSKPGQFFAGIPAVPHITWKRQLRAVSKLVTKAREQRTEDDRGA